MSEATGLWDVFIDEGSRLAATIEAVVAASDGAQYRRAASDAHNVAISALLLGCESIARLALDCERALVDVTEGRASRDGVAGALSSANGELRAAFTTLAAPNEADRFVDEEALAAASRRLAQMLTRDDTSPSTARSSLTGHTPEADPEAEPEAEPPSSEPPVEPVGQRSHPPPLPLPVAPPSGHMMHPALAAATQSGLAASSHPAISGASHPALSDSAPPVASEKTPSATVSTPPRSVPAPEAFHWQTEVDEELVQVFFVELEERLASLDEKLLALEGEEDNPELVGDIFRDLHTIKGNADLVGLRPLKELAHAAEDCVATLRSGARQADRALIDLLLETQEVLRVLSSAAQRGEPLERERERRLAARLRGDAPKSAPPAVARATQPATTPETPPPPPPPTSGPGPTTAPAPRPPSPTTTPAPPPRQGNPSRTAPTAAPQMLRIDFAKLDKLLNLVGELVLDKANVSSNLDRLGALSELLDAGRRRALTGSGEDTARLRDVLRKVGDDFGAIEHEVDDLLESLGRASQRLDVVTGDLRDQVMKMRMVPVGRVFRRFGVKVRELAHRHEKRVRLTIEGEGTELDKMLVEQLDAPLLHLVTNAVYHGIEPPQTRLAAGKPEEGFVRLRAHHEGNQIVIVIEDDGGGIDPDVVRRIAAERGVKSATELAGMDDADVRMLIFDPRFSRVTQVDEDAGRGVGTTVVWKTIVNELKGSIEVDSRVGQGSTFTLRLPLTLAIIQVLLVEVGEETYAIPLDIVRRTTTCRQDQIHLVCDREVVTLGDKQLPLIRLGDVLEVPMQPPVDQPSIVLVDMWGQSYGLVCDRLSGKREVVIKSLGDLLEEVRGVMGATLLGDRCMLILDVSVLVTEGMRATPRRATAATAKTGQSASADSGPRPRKRILVVDDSAMARQTIVRALEAADYDVVTANDGLEGLAAAERERFDLVSTDAMMPKMDGYQLTRALRDGGHHRDVPIVMVTSKGEPADRVKGFDAGVDAYIQKPFAAEELRAIVDAQLRPARGR